MQFHALGCKSKISAGPSNTQAVKSASSNPARSAEPVTAGTKRKATRTDTFANNLEPPSKRRETYAATAPLPTGPMQTTIDHSSPYQNISEDDSEPMPCSFSQPGLPGSDVLEFISKLPSISSDDPGNSGLFAALGRAGIRAQKDLDLLCEKEDKARKRLKKHGVDHIQWIVVRYSLPVPSHSRSEASNNKTKETSGDTQKFLEKRQLEYLSPIVGRLRFTPSDLKRLARSGDVWPMIKTYLLSQHFTFVDYLSFKRGILALRKILDPKSVSVSSDALQSFVDEHVEGAMKDCVKAALGRIGVDNLEALDQLSVASDMQMDTVLDMLSQEGLRWLECKAVREGLVKRTRKVKAEA
ncbi:hypothetical protein EIP91_012110 [Steccherinum ochraceum]|uniref:Uncharacterized protein n=1 Tax=Steccherinum ochraceum TaxID=92696 RepID=A0A4R0RVB1_9APHY|nr:hypothetical protein EIP91_012110 [Steccherinum ochraceum]